MSCRNPCKECPYQKGSSPGYFGGNDPMIYRMAIGGEEAIPCHMRSEHDDDGEVTNAKPCTGLLLSMKKSCKLPVSEELRQLVNKVSDLNGYEGLKKNALASWEFSGYHGIEEF